MIEGYSPVGQALLGTTFTWFVTALGAAVVFVLPSSLSHKTEQLVLDASLGFAAGVMLAASYWSLLEPSLSTAETLGYDRAYLPVGVGFIFGAAFVGVAEHFLPDDLTKLFEDSTVVEEVKPKAKQGKTSARNEKKTRRRSSRSASRPRPVDSTASSVAPSPSSPSNQTIKRILLLVLAVTVHNIPEGVSVGVGFGAAATPGAAMSFESAFALAVGIGLQNFPEGLAIALPLRRLGYSKLTCFFVGQLSGAVEPIGGVLGAWAVSSMTRSLPYFLAFAAGAMIYVVFDGISPEAHVHGNGSMASAACVVGFVVMMSLDVALG